MTVQGRMEDWTDEGRGQHGKEKKKKQERKLEVVEENTHQKKSFKKTRTKTCQKIRTRNLNFMERNITSNAKC